MLSLKSISEAGSEVGGVESGVEVEYACGLDFAFEDGAPVGVYIVACAEAEDRLPCALYLEIVDVGERCPYIPRAVVRTATYFQLVKHVEGLADISRRGVVVGIPIVHHAPEHTDAHGDIVHAVAEGDGGAEIVGAVASKGSIEEVGLQEEVADGERELRADRQRTGIDIRGREADIRLHLEMRVDGHEGAEVDVREVGIRAVVSVLCGDFEREPLHFPLERGGGRSTEDGRGREQD